MVTSESEIRHGSKIGRFVVVGELGSGGMGVVYAAHDRELDRQVALKVLRAAAATDEERMRMLREGQAMARVTHPNVITVFEVGVEGTLVFLAQELLDAGTLGQWLAKNPRSEADIIDKFVAAGRGLAAAHAAGLVHRDFKPDNVLLGMDGRVRVSDFGLARSLGPADDGLPAATRANMARAQLDLSRSPMSPLTRTGAVMGTPMFMAPEQHNGERADERSDQFAFSVALYHALYGDWPFPGKTAVALADAVIGGRLQRPPRDRHVPARLRKILVRGLATKPADRFASMDALLAELTRPPRRRVRAIALAVAALGLVAAAVIGGYALRTHDEPVVQPPPPLATFDPKTLSSDRGIAWMATAIERGQLDDALEKFDMAGALAQQNNDPLRASTAASAGALVLALRGQLAQARVHLQAADSTKATDPTALAYADMAAAAVASGAGELDVAAERSAHCATEFTETVPELAAMCHELHGDVAAARGDVAAARASYGDGLALAKRIDSPARVMTLELELAALDLDENKPDAVVAKATEVQTRAAEHGSASPEQQAWVLLARAHLAQAASRQALEDLDRVKPETIEAFRIKIAALSARGESVAMLGDPDDGLRQLDDARAQADKQGFPELALVARLARVEVMIAIAAPDAAAAQHALVTDARAHGYGRIARLAETVAQR